MKNIYLNVVLFVFTLMVSSIIIQIPQCTTNENQTYVELNIDQPGNDMEIISLELYEQESLDLIYKDEILAREIQSLWLPKGEYYFLANTPYLDIGCGYIGYKEFKITENLSTLSLDISLRPESDRSRSIDLTPSLDDMTIPEGYKAIIPENDSYNVPILIEENHDEIIDNSYPKYLDHQPVDTDGYWVYIGSNTKLYITHEETDILWHPICLVDSQSGATHELRLNYLDGEEMDFSSEIELVGVGGGGSYSKSFLFEVSDVTPTTASNGAVKTRLSEFKHVYQEGEYWYRVYDGHFWWWWYGGDFQREFISNWYTGSHAEKSYAYRISETREIYRGEWRLETTKNVKITDTTEYSGSLGFEVSRGDVFGSSTKIQFTNTHTVEAMHRIEWDPPTPTTYLKLYGGNIFDINLHSYDGGGGGCPYVGTWDGTQYLLDNNILYQSELFGTETDWIDRYVLTYKPSTRYGYHSLVISEFENEHSFIDQVRLLAVTHNQRTKIAVDPNGQILSFSNPKAPSSAINENGLDLTNILKSEDGSYFSGEPGSSVILDFKTHQFKHGARLVMLADA